MHLVFGLWIGLPFMFWLGFSLGRSSEAHRWRANADQIWRIESGGNLYKVKNAMPGDRY